MVKLVALWSVPSDKDGFDADYDATHRALCEKLPGVTATFSKVTSGSHHRMAELAFASSEELGAALGGPAGAELLGDAGRLQQAFGNTVETFVVEVV